MRVIFLSSAYSGYVHTWAYDPDLAPSEAAAPATPEQDSQPVAGTDRRASHARGAIGRLLRRWSGQPSEGQPC